MSDIYPPVAFYFKLSFSGVSGKVEASFKEVSGISLEKGIEEITEGGNSFIHRVPTAVKYSNLVLKRGLIVKDSAIAKWCIDSLCSDSLSEPIKTKDIVIQLLNGSGIPIKSWSFVNSWPVKWTISDLEPMENMITIESLEFSYSYFKSL